MARATLTIENTVGDDALFSYARIDRPAGTPIGYALLVHCFTCSNESRAVNQISKALTARGFAVLCFDFTGQHDGEDCTTYKSNIGSIVEAANYLRRHYQSPKLLIGHSLAGTALLAAAEHIPEARVLATIGAPADADELTHTARSATDDSQLIEEGEVNLAGWKFAVTKQLLGATSRESLAKKIGFLNRSLLVFHSPEDAVVPMKNALEIYEAAQHPKSLISLADADHFLAHHSDATYVAEVIVSWLQRHLTKPKMNLLRCSANSQVAITSGEFSGVKLAVECEDVRHHSSLNLVKPAINDEKHQSVRLLSSSVIECINEYIKVNLSERIGVSQLAQLAHCSKYHFIRRFKATTGKAPHQYLIDERITKARELLANGDLPLSEIAYSCGFSSQSHMTDVFGRHLSITPARYRKTVEQIPQSISFN